MKAGESIGIVTVAGTGIPRDGPWAGFSIASVVQGGQIDKFTGMYSIIISIN